MLKVSIFLEDFPHSFRHYLHCCAPPTDELILHFIPEKLALFLYLIDHHDELTSDCPVNFLVESVNLHAFDFLEVNKVPFNNFIVEQSLLLCLLPLVKQTDLFLYVTIHFLLQQPVSGIEQSNEILQNFGDEVHIFSIPVLICQLLHL